MGKNRILDHIQSGRLRAMILDGRYLIKKEDLVELTYELTYPFSKRRIFTEKTVKCY